MEDPFLVLLALVFGGLAVREAVRGVDRRRHNLKKRREHENAIANSLWEVRRREEDDKVFFYLWRYPGVTDENREWCVQLGRANDIDFIDQHAAVLAAVEGERDRRNFELKEIRRAAEKDKRSLTR